MSLILRIVLVIAGSITALFIARDSLNFELVQTSVAILVVVILLSFGSFRSLRQKT